MTEKKYLRKIMGIIADRRSRNSERGCGYHKLATWILVISFLVILILAPLASSLPDGLESVAEKLNFSRYAKDFPLKVPFPDYSLPALNNDYLSTVASGIAGMLIVLILATGIGYLIVRLKKKAD